MARNILLKIFVEVECNKKIAKGWTVWSQKGLPARRKERISGG